MRAAVLGDESPNVRKSDPIESHTAAERARPRAWTLAAIIRTLEVADEPMTSDHIWELAQLLGFKVTPARIRTVLAEESETFEAIEGGTSRWGNPCRLWKLKGGPQ